MDSRGHRKHPLSAILDYKTSLLYSVKLDALAQITVGSRSNMADEMECSEDERDELTILNQEKNELDFQKLKRTNIMVSLYFRVLKYQS